ncbi:DNA-formamidopyrimidine glycosylase family protein [Spirosoma sp. SC4-14]|uniref:Fpg/Nei family DNA glycosylase n=1 Tax=Spirosoma sp. SC4-14 TaxID=3128900 RepID=UPI0030D5DE43
MPELPEVEIRRQYLQASSLYQPISHIEVEDKKLLTTDYSTLLHQLEGRQFTGTWRVGKNLFILTDSSTVIVHMHFGMTGDLEYYHSSIGRPRFARIVFEFTNGFNLGFICPRKFERVGIIENIDAYLEQKKIAKDGLDISLADFKRNIGRKKALIKPVLLDQSVVAGLGNWIVDEVLFQAFVHPEQRVDSLSNEQISRIHEAIQFVLETAIRHEATYRDFPLSFLIHVREWDNSPYDDLEAHNYCPRCRTRIERSVVGGRTTFFCPKEQIIN